MFKNKMSFLLTAMVFCGAVFFQAAQTFGQGCIPARSGIVAWYPGDGNANDIINGGGSNGAIQGGVAFAPGEVAQAFNFDGTGSVVSNSPTLNVGTGNGLTINAWIKPTNVLNQQPIVEWNNGANSGPVNGIGTHLWIAVNSPEGQVAGALFANLIDTNGNSHIVQSTGRNLAPNVYQHVAVTYDKASGVANLFLNGDIIATQNLGTFTPQTSYPLYFGKRPVSNTFYTGALDEVQIFNRALTQIEVMQNFATGGTGNCKPATPLIPPTCTKPPPNMVAWYPGDGATNDISGSGNNGASQGTPAYAPGKVVQAFQFNNNGRINVPDSNSLDAANALTLDAWVNPTQSGGDNGTSTFVFKGSIGSATDQPYGILFGNTRQIVFSLGSAATFDRLASNTALPLNAYTHVAATYDGTMMRIYINGILDASKTTAIGTLLNDSQPLYFGDFLGALDELEIFNRALSQTEIQAVYNAGSFGKCKSNLNNRTDFDGDGTSDLGVFRPSPDPDNNYWYILRSSAGAVSSLEWGVGTDKIAPADYDGDGKTDIAVWRENVDGDRAYFYIVNSRDNTIRIDQFGATGDRLTVGDWDGDGQADLAVYRDSAVGAQSYFFYRPSSQSGVNFNSIPWGAAGDKPARGDFDGDGRLDAAIYRPSTGTWIISQSSDSQIVYRQFGVASDNLVPADYDGDGRTDIAVFRDGVWIILLSNTNQVRYQQWGVASDALAPTDYDGDGRADIAVYRGGVYFIIQSSNRAIAYRQFGAAGDVPVASAYNQ